MRRRRFAGLSAFLVLSLCGTLAVNAGAPQWKGASPNPAGTFRFVVMGDNTGTPAPGEWEEAVREVNLLKPDFVMSVGDFITGYAGEKDAIERMWDEFEEKLKKLEPPFYFCCGNHDVSSPLMREVWLSRYGVDGRSYYSFDRGGCRFIVLDTATAVFQPSSMQEQLAWLKQNLSSAKDAAHVFVFFHHPQMDNKEVWQELVKILPAGKTTIFNGHIHDLSYGVVDGIPVYILGSSGAEVRTHDGMPNRPLGKFRMLTLVTVRDGAPTVAVFPLHEVLPGELVSMEFSNAFNACLWPQANRIAQTGGVLTHRYHNALSAPLRISTSWNAPDWAVRPASSETTIPPGSDGELRFSLTPRSGFPDFPDYTVVFRTTDPSGQEVAFTAVRRAWFPAELEIALVSRVAVDGDARDWRRVTPYELTQKSRVHSGADSWNGEKDCSCRIFLGHDRQRLYVCLDVTDDQIAIDDDNWELNDGIQFFWDSRPKDRRDGAHGIGTGHLALRFPREGDAPTAFWMTSDRPAPQGLVSAIRRTAAGYVCEFSLPLSEIGIPAPPEKGLEVLIEFKIDDRDLVDGKRTFSSMDISGRRGNAEATGHYARCRFR